MKFQFSTSLTNVQVPGATVSIDKIDVSVSMEMEDEAYNGLIEMVYNRMAAMFGVPSTEKPEPEAPEASEGGYIVLCREDDKVGGTRGASGYGFGSSCGRVAP